MVGVALGLSALGCGQSITVVQTASTNHAEIRLTVNGRSKSMAIGSGAQAHVIPYDLREWKRFLKVVSTAGKLSSLTTSHCMKSASFGSQLFIEVNGDRSPDLSCVNQADPRVAALRAQAEKMLQIAEAH